MGKPRGSRAGRGGGSGGGRLGGNQPGAGPDGQCVCPSCGKRVPHVAGQPSYDIACPKYGTKMVRE